jgi:hypothetical protein
VFGSAFSLGSIVSGVQIGGANIPRFSFTSDNTAETQEAANSAASLWWAEQPHG